MRRDRVQASKHKSLFREIQGRQGASVSGRQTDLGWKLTDQEAVAVNSALDMVSQAFLNSHEPPPRTLPAINHRPSIGVNAHVGMAEASLLGLPAAQNSPRTTYSGEVALILIEARRAFGDTEQ